MTQAPLSLKDHCRTTVDALIKTCQDRSARSVLRPLLSGIPEMQIRAMRYLPRNSAVHQDLLYLIAGLIAEYPCEPDKPLSFGASLDRLSKHADINATGIERRLESLLQLDLDSLVQPLHSLILQARGTEIPVDYTMLLYHLRCWDDSRKWVQLAWARDFWCSQADGEEPKPDETSALEQG
jgi:CRISPR type I-E-associated protein CasB/Cse2